MPAALRAQQGERGLGHPECPEQVRLELVAHVGLAELFDQAEVPITGVVDDDVEPTEMRVRLLDRGEVLRAVGHVELDRQEPVAVLGHEVIERAQVARSGRDRITSLEGRNRPFAAEASGRTGDEPRFSHPS